MPEQLENDETQEAYWELQKFLVLALKANPNVLECLYTPLVEKATPLAEELLAMRSIFLSRMVYQTYNGYVLSQFKKMQADIRNQGQVKWKHVMHLIRLLLSGISVLREGFVPVRVEEHREQAAGDPAGRGAVGGGRGLAAERCTTSSTPRSRDDEAAGAPGLRAGQCVSDQGPPRWRWRRTCHDERPTLATGRSNSIRIRCSSPRSAGRTCTASRRRIRTSTCAACICCRSRKSSA